jgi:hypothetical protein
MIANTIANAKKASAGKKTPQEIRGFFAALSLMSFPIRSPTQAHIFQALELLDGGVAINPQPKYEHEQYKRAQRVAGKNKD